MCLFCGFRTPLSSCIFDCFILFYLVMKVRAGRVFVWVLRRLLGSVQDWGFAGCLQGVERCGLGLKGSFGPRICVLRSDVMIWG